MLGGGIPLGKITEFCGVPGIGKIQLGMTHIQKNALIESNKFEINDRCL